MMVRRFRSLVPLALLGAAVVGVAPMVPTPALARTKVVSAEVLLLDDSVGPNETIGLVMGGSGTPIPGTVTNFNYMQAADQLFINNPLHPNFPNTSYPAPYSQGLFTPEGLYPLTGPKTLPFNFANGSQGYTDPQTSVGQGVFILNNAINSNTFYQDTSTVFGYSQSATIAGEWMKSVDPSGTPSSFPHAQFVLIGDPSNPNGGLLERFGPSDVTGLTRPELTLPSMGLQFDGATPANDFPTVIYTREYDGFADFPRYPINFLSDLNAFLGIETIHGHYLDGTLSQAQIAPFDATTNPDGAILLDTQGPTETTYYMIPMAPGESLPLLSPVRDIPVVGNPIADLLQPDLRLVVNLGYDNPNPLEGWDSGPANVPTPFELVPSFQQILGAIEQLPAQTELGITNFIGDLSHLSLPSLASGPSSLFSALADPTATLQSLSHFDIVTDLSNAIASLTGILGPTVDIGNAVVTAIPAYNVDLLLDNLSNPLNAVGLPIAADVALFTLAAGFEFEVVSSAISAAVGAF